MARLERIGTMIPGLPVPVILDGQTKFYKCQEDSKGTRYIQPNKVYVKEEDCPMGEVIEI